MYIKSEPRYPGALIFSQTNPHGGYKAIPPPPGGMNGAKLLFPEIELFLIDPNFMKGTTGLRQFMDHAQLISTSTGALTRALSSPN